MKERSAPRPRRTAKPPRARKQGWLTPKRAVILGTTAVVLVGGGGFTVYTAIQNAAAPPTQALGLDELSKMLGGDPFGPDPEADVLKAHAAQKLKADKLAAQRGKRKALDPIVIPKEAPGGGGFDPQALPPGTANPTGNKALGKQMLEARGWSDQWGCLEKLWMKESGWNERAMNRYSGAYGIPQSLPGHKMASAGNDWQVNAATQIEWGLGYIKGRYGTPCGAWGHSQAKGWY
ncbi:lytic transglycosylase domain-containing protein [Streptosporangium sp. NBC_01639]|uniref:aggregation-promoting factor C-terminal-like domain-containing protein n=1 Tax=Streptosporangium sp. NBC_01639 TaxID=2975948 RepID=UPI003864B609|nr:lytic transglycosylase domain-containing protein [Streptosporangium sp. NBC_01639]